MEKVLLYAMKWDVDTATRIQACKEEKRPIHYHRVCKLNYVNDIRKIVATSATGSWHKTRKNYQTAFSRVCEYVEENVIEKREAVTEKLIRKLFEESLQAQYTAKNAKTLKPQNRHIRKRVEVRLRKHVKFITHKKLKVCVRRGTKVAINIDELDEKELLTKAALVLRRHLRNSVTVTVKSKSSVTI